MSSPIQVILLDMDGLLYQGEKVVPEALSFISAIAHLPHTFITNNPILSSPEIADKLEHLGLKRLEHYQIITSAEATALWISQQQKNFRYYAVGSEGLHTALRQHGFEDIQQADFVVIGEGAGIDFNSITTGVNLIIKQGAKLICTNLNHSVDATIDGRQCVLPGGGLW